MIKQFTTIKAVREWRHGLEHIALVPTMGNLHEGHLSLIRAAKKNNAPVIVSIFVNPTQFGVNEDFNSYPRTIEEDLAKAERAGADAIFIPSVETLYPHGEQTLWINPGTIATLYCGESRPIHFRGVATVVAKLFNIVQPKWVFFGKKDFQQLMIIKQMVAQLNFEVEIIGIDTKRENSGLALSSRNQYLSPTQKQEAARLYQELCRIKNNIINGQKDFQTLCLQAKTNLEKNGWGVDYIVIVNQNDLQIARPEDKTLVILAAAKLGTTRLIDNIDFSL